MQNTHIRGSRTDRLYDIAVYIILALLLLLILYPLYFIVIASVSDPVATKVGKVIFWPSGFTLDGYKKVLEYEHLGSGYRNTILYTVAKTVLSTFLTLLAGFALSRKNLVARRGILLFFSITLFFSGGMIPTYLLVSQMGLIDKPAVIVLVGLVSVYNIIITRAFMEANIPDSLQEAAFIDGCSYARFFFSVVLPLSPAIISVIALFIAVGQWNSWFNAMLYLRKDEYMPLQYWLRRLLTSMEQLMNETELTSADNYNSNLLLAESMKYAIIIVASLPILCLYPFLQRYFVKGVMVGSLKG